MQKIISHIIGGLGNQMFQYAIARAIAVKTGRQLELDTVDFARYPLRPFLLDRFRISASHAAKDMLRPVRVHPRELRKPYCFLAGWQVIEEREHPFHQLEIRDKASVVYLRGYWQTERYFTGIEELIRSDFALLHEPDDANRAVLQAIQDCNAVALHVRRGDYVSNPATSLFHGNCDHEYYQKAIQHMEESLARPHFYVFSDDIPWTREHLKTSHPITFVDHNSPADPCEDLRLLSACKHFVIANSSFSWWGAWLSEHPGKQIIAPRQWFQSPDKDTRDQVPESWLRL